MYSSKKRLLPTNCNDKSLGEFEKSQLRHILEVIDNAI